MFKNTDRPTSMEAYIIVDLNFNFILLFLLYRKRDEVLEQENSRKVQLTRTLEIPNKNSTSRHSHFSYKKARPPTKMSPT